MKKVIKLKQRDIVNVVNQIIENELDNVQTSETEQEYEPSAQKIIDNTILEPRPEVKPVTPSGGKIGIVKDNQGTYYVMNYETGEILGKKS